ncbi:hypothetical protein EJ06DRAFT_559800 [Trichodelitschia bisporula]|uniref:Uncharacterized protein n=1 Tax=Trichodelitschia bisporula TaxID=703511 RepID=A0A6G1HLF0_9PEZI|nr:hypothetical protein EJ06DRAFT_559800 [Trichodelitschia bisporula]
MPALTALASFVRSLLCGTEQPTSPTKLEISAPTDFRREEVILPGLTDEDRAFLAAKTAENPRSPVVPLIVAAQELPSTGGADPVPTAPAALRTEHRGRLARFLGRLKPARGRGMVRGAVGASRASSLTLRGDEKRD